MLYVAELVTRGSVSLPLAGFVPLHDPEAIHEDAQGADHDSVGTLFAPMVVVRLTDGASPASAKLDRVTKAKNEMNFFTDTPSTVGGSDHQHCFRLRRALRWRFRRWR